MAKLRSNPDANDGNIAHLLHRTIQCLIRAAESSAELFENQTFINRGVVAQRLEHLLCKQDVEGSSPFDSTRASGDRGSARFSRLRLKRRAYSSAG